MALAVRLSNLGHGARTMRHQLSAVAASCGNLYHRAGLKAMTGLALVSPLLASATPEPEVAAFAAITTRVTAIGALAFALAIVGTGIWIGIDLFKKGAKKGAK